MKWVGIAIAALVLGVVLLEPSTRAGPEPIAFGRDACAQCRMIISQAGFGGQFRDRDGDLRKFDDLGCMLRAMLAQRREIPEAWVEDHPSGELVPLLDATLVRAPATATPMGHGVLAFAGGDAARDFAVERGGTVVTFEELIRDTVRLASAAKSSAREGER